MAASSKPVYELIANNKRMRGFPNLAKFFLDDPQQIPELVGLATGNLPHPFPEYASWLLTHISKKAPDLVQPFYEKILIGLFATRNETVKRNLLGAIKYQPLHPFMEGELLDCLLKWIADPQCKPAVFMYGLETLCQFCKRYPEIYHEIDEIITLRAKFEITPAMKVSIKKFRVLKL
jgi:hypothetical protein